MRFRFTIFQKKLLALMTTTPAPQYVTFVSHIQRYVLTLEQETQKLENDRDTYREQVKRKGVDGGH